MFSPELQELIERHTGTIRTYTALSGGDIHRILKLQTDSGQWIAKVATSPHKIESLKTELKGLKRLASTQTFHIPELAKICATPSSTALVMRYVESVPPQVPFWENFAEKLCLMHSYTQCDFGLDHDNFIGALPQKNSSQHSAVDHYITDRLEPQIKRAHDTGLRLELDNFYNNLQQLIPEQAPALIHGDLWHGNYLSGSNGPVLIDPAIGYSIAQMDLAMMDLFSGFPELVFEYYASRCKLPSNWRSTLDIYQLYYLLAHLNMFGVSYLDSIKRILNKYS